MVDRGFPPPPMAATERPDPRLAPALLGVAWTGLGVVYSAFALMYAAGLERDDDDAVTLGGLLIALAPGIIAGVGGLWTCVVRGRVLRTTSIVWATTSALLVVLILGHLLTTNDGMDVAEWFAILLLTANLLSFIRIAQAL